MTGPRRSSARHRRGWAGPVSAAPAGESGDQEPAEDEAGSSPYDVDEELPDRVKRRIAAELAIFRTSIEIKALLRERHGIQARLREVMRFAEPLRTLFEQLSADYVNGSTGLHIASQAYRLRRLQRLSLLVEQDKDYAGAAKLLEQARKEHEAGQGQAAAAAAQGPGPDGTIPLTPQQARVEIEAFLRRWEEKRDAGEKFTYLDEGGER
jgi:hypothetical protein